MDLYEQKWSKMLARVQRMDLYERPRSGEGRKRFCVPRAGEPARHLGQFIINELLIAVDDLQKQY